MSFFALVHMGLSQVRPLRWVKLTPLIENQQI